MGALERIVKTFNCVVRRIEGDMAHVSIYDSQKGESCASMLISGLEAPEGISVGEGYRFKMEVIEAEGKLDLRFKYVSPRELTEKDYRQIQRELDKAIPDSLLDLKDDG